MHLRFQMSIGMGAWHCPPVLPSVTPVIGCRCEWHVRLWEEALSNRQARHAKRGALLHWADYKRPAVVELSTFWVAHHGNMKLWITYKDRRGWVSGYRYQSCGFFKTLHQSEMAPLAKGGSSTPWWRVKNCGSVDFFGLCGPSPSRRTVSQVMPA